MYGVKLLDVYRHMKFAGILKVDAKGASAQERVCV